MIDFFLRTRQDMIDNLQVSLRAVRQLLKLSAQDLAELIGVTRQTINNLETGKSQMTSTQYVSICAVIDNYTAEKPEILNAIIAVLSAGGAEAHKSDVSNVHNCSFLKKWFLSFPGAGQEGSEFLTYTTGDQDGLLKLIAQNYKVFCDGSILMLEQADGFFWGLAEKLLAAKNHLIVPMRVVEYLQQSMLSHDADEVGRARRALSLLSEMQKQGTLQMRGEKSDSNIYSTFISVFAKFKSSYRLFLITQDAALAGDIIGMNRKEGMSGFPISAGYLTKGGDLMPYEAAVTPVLEKAESVEECDKEDDGINIEDVYKGWDSIG